MRRVAIGATACRSGRIDGSARSTSRVLARQHDRRVFAVSRRAMDGRLPKGRRTLATPQRARLPWIPARGQRMGDTSPSRAEGQQSAATKGSLGENDCAAHDREARSHEQSGHCHCRRYPGGRAVAGRGSCAHRAIPRHDQKEGSRSTRPVDRRSKRQSRLVFRDRRREPWSNVQVEAQITKLKLVKRQMYGRAKLDLLQARLLGAA